jgi:putative FmdB family regulatory protein
MVWIHITVKEVHMPIYEYQCEQCGLIEEAFQKFSEAPLTICKNCSGSLHKIISQSAFHLKGSGWYVTDYADKKSSPGSAATAPKKEKPQDKASASGSEASTSE